MSHWALVTLYPESWDLSVWPAEPARGAFPEGYEGRILPLGELVRTLPVREPISGHRRVVSPADIDPESGIITGTRDARSRTGCSIKGDLERGDILVPRHGSAPCLLVDEALSGFTFVNFIPVRPLDQLTALSLWSVLSCETGIRARQEDGLGSTAVQRNPSSLLELCVPILPLDDVHRTELSLLRPYPAVEISDATIQASDWATVDLSPRSWWDPVAMAGLPELDGPTLGDLAVVVDGQEPRTTPLELELPGGLPLADQLWIKTGRVRKWVERQGATPAPAASIAAFVREGLHARVLEREMALDQGLVGILAPEGGTLPSVALASHLNRDSTGVRLRQANLHSRAPNHRASAFAALRLPPLDQLRNGSEGRSQEAHSLAQALEEALWRE